jgi:hypothetical protein
LCLLLIQVQAALASAGAALKLLKAAVPAAPQRDITVLQDYMLTLTQALPPVAPLKEQSSTNVAGSNSSNSSAEQQQVCTHFN